MDKNAIKKYAVWARNELIARVTQKAEQYEITEKKTTPAEADSIGGRLLSEAEKKQRAALIEKIKTDGFEQVMEEVAYTWFNRFTALRFMEVNNYLPSHTRVFTNEAGEFKPQILADAIQLDLEGLDMDKVFELKDANKTEELYKYLLITQCNALSSVLPRMFQKIAHYTELLLPDYLLREGSVIEQMIALIPEEDWTDQVQIIGWLYEAYNSERNEQVYDGTLSKEKISKEFLPAATTIFTPDWPVHYMVENSLGRLWMEGHPSEEVKEEWKYYLEEVEQEGEAKIKLEVIRESYASMKPEDILVIDPCMGSGHILCVLFDVLVNIYESYGYTAREAAEKIVENNLWGMDIDDRAGQLAYFAVMMKARQYDRRFFSRNIQPNVYAICESNNIKEVFGQIKNELPLSAEQKETLRYLIQVFEDAKEYGSILQIENRNYSELKKAWGHIGLDTNVALWHISISEDVQRLIDQAIALSQKYHVVVTNPPYLGNTRFSPLLDKYVKDNYAEVKSDLSMVMYKHTVDDMVAKNGFVAFITTSSWMFLGSFEKLRIHLENTASFSSLVDFGTELFEGKVGHNPIVAWVVRKSRIDSKMTAIRLVDYCYSRRDEKEPEYFESRNRYVAKQSSFEKVPSNPIVYWVKNFEMFDMPKLSEFIDARIGMVSGDNDRFLRFWQEVSFDHIEFCAKAGKDPQRKKWYPLQKGGEYRLWYGNLSYVINWENDGYELKYDNYMGKRVRSHNYNGIQQFKEGITWNSITSGNFHCRYSPEGFTFDAAGPLCEVIAPNKLYLVLAMLSSKVATYLFSLINPTINFPSGYLESLPYGEPENSEYVKQLAQECINISKQDWDSFENSWEFKEHPLVSVRREKADIKTPVKICDIYDEWCQITEDRFSKIKENEEALNDIFIDVYGLRGELSPEILEKEVTVRKADRQRDIRSLISYAVGCMFGRYSLDCKGLVYAGGEWDQSKYESFIPDKDAIIPICDDEYFDDDIVGRFVSFIETVFGKGTLEENLRFIADAIGGKGTSRDVIRNYFINDFYADHIKIYQKRPIYWLFDSGKKNGFKCLVYMHRYHSDTIARIRTDYIHEQQSRYRTAIADLEQRKNSAGTSDRVSLNRKLTTLQDQAKEIREYEERIHHLADQMISIDLDEGVKNNYEIFKDVLAKIK